MSFEPTNFSNYILNSELEPLEKESFFAQLQYIITPEIFDLLHYRIATRPELLGGLAWCAGQQRNPLYTSRILSLIGHESHLVWGPAITALARTSMPEFKKWLKTEASEKVNSKRVEHVSIYPREFRQEAHLVFARYEDLDVANAYFELSDYMALAEFGSKPRIERFHVPAASEYYGIWSVIALSVSSTLAANYLYDLGKKVLRHIQPMKDKGNVFYIDVRTARAIACAVSGFKQDDITIVRSLIVQADYFYLEEPFDKPFVVDLTDGNSVLRVVIGRDGTVHDKFQVSPQTFHIPTGESREKLLEFCLSSFSNIDFDQLGLTRSALCGIV